MVIMGGSSITTTLFSHCHLYTTLSVFFAWFRYLNLQVCILQKYFFQNSVDAKWFRFPSSYISEYIGEHSYPNTNQI